jgi:hypothetical protein
MSIWATTLPAPSIEGARRDTDLEYPFQALSPRYLERQARVETVTRSCGVGRISSLSGSRDEAPDEETCAK